MKPHQQALLSGIIAGITTFLGWFIALPPEQQNSLIAPIIATVPVARQPNLAVGMKLIGTASSIYAVFKAAQSGPAKPPST